jgi:hypothetical protein
MSGIFDLPGYIGNLRLANMGGSADVLVLAQMRSAELTSRSQMGAIVRRFVAIPTSGPG